MIREFREQHPDIECDFDLGMRSVDPINNPFDLILRFGQQPDSSLISRKIVLMAHQLYASPEYLARHGEPRVRGSQPSRVPAAHHARRVILLDAPFGRQGGTRAGIGRLAANNVGMLGRLASQGLGITPLLVFDAMERAIKQSGLVRVLPEWSLTPLPLFALLPSRMLPAKTKAFLDFIQPRLNEG